MSHTPGPWTIYPGNGGGFVVRGSVPTEGVHATTHSEADACLIAAAPDLLALVEEAWEGGREDMWYVRAGDVIAKVRGESEAPPTQERAEGASR